MTKKILARWIAGLLGIGAAVVVAKQPHGAKPTPPSGPPSVPSYTLVVHVCEGSCERNEKRPGANVTVGDVDKGQADSAGNLEIPDVTAGRYTVCAAYQGFTRGCAAHSVPADGGELFLELERDVPPILPLTADGRIFRAGGEPWRWKGVSAFKLLDRFARGEDISDFLTAYRGYNVLRVWPYVEWGAAGWDSPSPDVVVAFLSRVARDGFYVELTLTTDDKPARLDQAKRLVEALKAARPPNLVLEAGNEPTTNKAIDTSALRATLEASGFLYSSGDYEDSARFYGTYGTAHTGRSRDWTRRAHDLLEYFQGGGPNSPSDPAHRVPWVADEPGKPEDVGTNPAEWRAYFGAASLMGAGATFHCESCKYARVPTATEAQLAAVALEAMNAFPADAALGGYRRLVEQGQPPDARTYVIGERYMVRCQQNGVTAPESGWTAIDRDGILWRQ